MLSILIPSHNEPNVKEFVREIYDLGIYCNVIVQEDTDGRGKGWALREAMKDALGNNIVFLDGDGDIKPYEIKKLIPYLKQYDVVVGKKELPLRKDRKIITFLSRFYIKFMFGINIDTQTGLKGFNYKPEWKTDGWMFDVEIIYKAKKMKKTMIDIPIKATVSGSKGIKDIWESVKETMKIRFSQ